MNRSRVGGIAVGILLVGLTACTGSGASTTTIPPTVVSTTVSIETTTTTDAITGAPTTTATPSPPTTTIPLADVSIRLVEIDSGFDSPVLIVKSPDGGADLVVEQPGRVVRADGAGHEVVLDLSGDVEFGGEQGLLGFAVHPDFEENGLVYVNYSGDGGATVIEQFVMADGRIERDTGVRILTIDQPAGNHNGGMLAFGPDGYLWIGMGDGGASDDRFQNGQNADTLLGSMLRIVVGVPGGPPYGIPPDNPFADGAGGRAEVWAVGLRNPWRFAFDGDTVWIADVGQGSLEEVNATQATESGLNYGWSIMEGTECYKSATCDPEGLVQPITEYSHPDGCSITGGVVYRGSRVPSITGQFFFADFCTGLFRSIDINGAGRDWTDMVGTFGNATGFGIGSDGEMYLVTQQGTLLTLEAGDNG